MLNLPSATSIEKRIPKQKFYENLTISPELKRTFIDCIKQINWANKLSADTLNVSAGETVSEIQVFHILLSNELPNDSVLRQIDKEIPYHILYVLQIEDKYKLCIVFKESSESGKNAFKVGNYFVTPWLNEEDLSISFTGLTMDDIYESIVRFIAGDRLKKASNESLKESVEKAERIKKLKSEAEKLEKLAWSEKQPQKKYELVLQINKLKAEIEELSNG